MFQRYPALIALAGPIPLYHYTSAGALMGIAGDHGFRLGHFAYMNDVGEYWHGVETQWILAGLGKKPFYSQLSHVPHQPLDGARVRYPHIPISGRAEMAVTTPRTPSSRPALRRANGIVA
jgi:hypothetical protein